MRGRIGTAVVIWAGWAALMLVLPVLTRARFELARPDHATSWTAAETAADPHAAADLRREDWGLMRILAPHAAWDSVYYLSIAGGGYEDPEMRAVAPNSEPGQTVFAAKREQPGWVSMNHSFFPLYPWAMRLAAWPLTMAGLAQPAALLAAGVAVSLLGTLGAMLALIDLARPRRTAREPPGASLPPDKGDGLRAATYLLVWPASMFLAQVYTEGLFVGLSFGALALLRRRRWAWAALLAALAVWTRSTGALLILPFAWRWLADAGLVSVRSRERRGRALGEGLLALAPLVAYAAWRAIYGHDFFFVEGRYFGRELLALARSADSWVQTMDDLLGRNGAQASAYMLFEALGVVAGTGACLALIRREPGLALYGLALIVLAVTSGSLSGIQRFVLGAPALFLAPARWGRSAAFDRLWTLAGAMGLTIFVIAFGAGFWAG